MTLNGKTLCSRTCCADKDGMPVWVSLRTDITCTLEFSVPQTDTRWNPGTVISYSCRRPSIADTGRAPEKKPANLSNRRWHALAWRGHMPRWDSRGLQNLQPGYVEKDLSYETRPQSLEWSLILQVLKPTQQKIRDTKKQPATTHLEETVWFPETKPTKRRHELPDTEFKITILRMPN